MNARPDERGAAERLALFPGTFDPVTLGHLDLIRKAARLFDRVYVGVLENPAKKTLFRIEERVDLLGEAVREPPGELSNVEVVSFEGLTVQLAVKLGARWIVRGIRSSADLEYELAMARSNARLSEPPVETVFLPASPAFAFIAAHLVREIAAGGGSLTGFVTSGVESALRRKLGRT